MPQPWLKSTCHSNDHKSTCHSYDLKSTCHCNDLKSTCDGLELKSTCHGHELKSTCHCHELKSTCHSHEFKSTCCSHELKSTCHNHELKSTSSRCLIFFFWKDTVKLGSDPRDLWHQYATRHLTFLLYLFLTLSTTKLIHRINAVKIYPYSKRKCDDGLCHVL